MAASTAVQLARCLAVRLAEQRADLTAVRMVAKLALH